MTSRFAKVSIFVCNIFLVFHLKLADITGLVPLRCEIWLVHSVGIGVTIAILFVSCVVMNVIVYQETKTHFSESRRINVDTNERLRTSKRVREVEMVVIVEGNILESNQYAANESEFLDVRESFTFPIRDRITSVGEMSIQRGKEIPSKMEIEATRSLVIGVFSLASTVVCLITVLLLTISICQLFGVYDYGNLNWLANYIKELVLVHAVYNPLIFLCKNEELRKSLMAIR
jgi:uncharacterized membrane protein